MLTAALALGGIGLLAALGLGVAAKVFYVYVDPLILDIEDALPGANCGGCGLAGCSSAAQAMAKGTLAPTGCVGGGPEVAVEVATLLGVSVTESEPEIAQVGCRYPLEKSDLKFDYSGVASCRGAFVLMGGPKQCPVGCIGMGSCVTACPFDALSLDDEGLPVVDLVRCTGCGTCVRTCPMGIMTLTSTTDRILNEYSWDKCHAPCQRTCPAGIDIPAQIQHTAKGDYDSALLVIKERNPLPLICGRICPRPCELECRRNLSDEPVAINYLKRFVADQERMSGQRLQPFKAPSTGHQMAVIGGGVEGLTAAYYLARLGHTPTIYEAMDKMGGLLRTVIPENRLPRDVLDFEIQGILDMGVEAKTGQTFGRDVTISQLFDQGNEAILIATGGWDSFLVRDTGPAPALPEVMLLLPITLAWASGQEVNVGSNVVIVGGGKTALDAAKQCWTRGADGVTVLLKGSKDDSDLSENELNAAEVEGIEVVFDTHIVRLMGQDNKLTQLVYSLPSGQEQTIDVDSVIAAAGRLPDTLIVPRKPELNDTTETDPAMANGSIQWQTVMPYIDPKASPRGMFDNAEPVRDYLAAVEAIGAGRRMAGSMHQYLTGQDVTAPARMLTSESQIIDVDHLEDLFPTASRQQMALATPAQRLDPTREIELGLDPASAKKEADRCLNCGLICYDRTDYGQSKTDDDDGYYTLQSSLVRI